MSARIDLGRAPVLPPWLRRLARRAVLLVWWAITLQLRQRFVLWRRAKQIRRLAPITPALQPILIHHADPRQIRVPHSADPAVSIIVPCYGKVEYTLSCLASIAAHPPEAAIEVQLHCAGAGLRLRRRRRRKQNAKGRGDRRSEFDCFIQVQHSRPPVMKLTSQIAQPAPLNRFAPDATAAP